MDENQKLTEIDAESSDVEDSDIEENGEFENSKREDIVLPKTSEEIQAVMHGQMAEFEKQLFEYRQILERQNRLTEVNPLNLESITIEYFSNERKKKLTPAAIKGLCSIFSIKDYLSPKEVRYYASRFNTTVPKVKFFFAAQKQRVRNLLDQSATENDTGLPPLAAPSANTVKTKRLPLSSSNATLPAVTLVEAIQSEQSMTARSRLLSQIFRMKKTNSTGDLMRLSNAGCHVAILQWLDSVVLDEQTTLIKQMLKALAFLPVTPGIPFILPDLAKQVLDLQSYLHPEIVRLSRGLLALWEQSCPGKIPVPADPVRQKKRKAAEVESKPPLPAPESPKRAAPTKPPPTPLTDPSKLQSPGLQQPSSPRQPRKSYLAQKPQRIILVTEEGSELPQQPPSHQPGFKPSSRVNYLSNSDLQQGSKARASQRDLRSHGRAVPPAKTKEFREGAAMAPAPVKQEEEPTDIQWMGADAEEMSVQEWEEYREEPGSEQQGWEGGLQSGLEGTQGSHGRGSSPPTVEWYFPFAAQLCEDGDNPIAAGEESHQKSTLVLPGKDPDKDEVNKSQGPPCSPRELQPDYDDSATLLVPVDSPEQPETESEKIFCEVLQSGPLGTLLKSLSSTAGSANLPAFVQHRAPAVQLVPWGAQPAEVAQAHWQTGPSWAAQSTPMNGQWQQASWQTLPVTQSAPLAYLPAQHNGVASHGAFGGYPAYTNNGPAFQNPNQSSHGYHQAWPR